MTRIALSSWRKLCPMRNKSAHNGLTLVELLIAISVLGIVAVLGWRGLDGIVRSRIALTDDLEQTRGMQLAFAQLQSDCAHLANGAILQNRLPLLIDQGRLSLVRTVFADDQPTRLQVVTYRISNGVLTRRESAATRDLNELDKLWLIAGTDADTTQPVKLQSGVSMMSMRLWDGGAWRTAGALPPGTATVPPVPSGLEITLQLRENDSGMLKVFMLGAV